MTKFNKTSMWDIQYGTTPDEAWERLNNKKVSFHRCDECNNNYHDHQSMYMGWGTLVLFHIV
jgi:ribosomal protein L37AE/L43A